MLRNGNHNIGLSRLIWNILCDIFQPAIQNSTELVQRVRGNRHVRLEALDSCMTHTVLEAEGVSCRIPFGHRFPQRCV